MSNGSVIINVRGDANGDGTPDSTAALALSEYDWSRIVFELHQECHLRQMEFGRIVPKHGSGPDNL
jgi:hypothetical protein